MNQFKIKPSLIIPYFDHTRGFFKTIKRSAKRRGINPFLFIIRKFINICLFRISYFCPLNSLRVKFHRWRGVKIGRNVYIGTQCSIDNAYPDYIYIEDDASIAAECTIIAHSNPYSHFCDFTPSKVDPVIIRRGAWIGIRSLILPGTTIGEFSIISGGSVISVDVPPCSVASGNPAKIIAKNLSIK